MFRIWIFILFAALFACKKNRIAPQVIPPTDTGEVIAPTYMQTAVYRSVGSNVGGFYQAVPPGYNNDTAKKYPLLVFLHGGGELGNGNRELPLVLKNALPNLLDKKRFPNSFTVDGNQFSFVILTPQFKVWPKPADVDTLIRYALENYRIDTHRLYLAGLSMGGGATWEYAADHGRALAAIVPICGASWADENAARRLADTDVPIWAFHNKDDSAVSVRSTTRYVDFIEKENPEIPLRMTLWETGGHDAWTKATDPGYRENDKNIYEWMLQYFR